MDLVAMFHHVSISLTTNVQCEQSQVTISSWASTERVKPDHLTWGLTKFSPAFLQVLVNCPGSKHKMIYQMHAKFAKRFRKTAGGKMDSKCIFNLLLHSPFPPQKEWRCEAHWNQWEDFQAFQWALIYALREQIAHIFGGHCVNDGGPWIPFMKAWLDQDWARKTRSFWVIRGTTRHAELRAALETQGWPTAAS